jgi:hypothetical protein
LDEVVLRRSGGTHVIRVRDRDPCDDRPYDPRLRGAKASNRRDARWNRSANEVARGPSCRACCG